jgi:hypothetical protein
MLSAAITATLVVSVRAGPFAIDSAGASPAVSPACGGGLQAIASGTEADSRTWTRA